MTSATAWEECPLRSRHSEESLLSTIFDERFRGVLEESELESCGRLWAVALLGVGAGLRSPEDNRKSCLIHNETTQSLHCGKVQGKAWVNERSFKLTFIAFQSIVGYIFLHFMAKQLKSRYKRLLVVAHESKSRAHAPYSNFRVGAALESTSGRIYSGCNIEISSYGLTMCAERTAVFKAVSEGERNFRAIAVVADDPDFTPPCGACRQVLFDLAGNIDVIMVNGKGKVRIEELKNLLPLAFTSKHLRPKKKRKT
jgi:cytidine deaminase